MHKPYPRYRDSGVEWLGDVSEHWEVKRLKQSIAGAINGVWGDEPDGENDIPCIRVADFDRRKFRVNFNEPTQRAITPSQRTGRELRAGDLLLEKSGGGEKQMVGCVVLYDHGEPAISSNFIARISTAPGESPEFWTYVHAALYAAKLNYRAIKQTTGIQNLDSDVYFDTEVGFPPLVEQEAIADFLDRETARIDAIIEKKRRMTALLEERWLEGVRRVVTDGVYFRNPLRVESSECPAGRRLTKLPWAFSFGSGTTPQSGDETLYDGGVPWVLTGDLKDHDLSRTSRTVTEKALRVMSVLKVHPAGSLVIAMYGATIGKLAVLRIPATVNQACAVLTPTRRDSADYLFYWLLAHRTELIDMGQGAGQPNVSQDTLRAIRLALPAPEQQVTAVEALRRLHATVQSATRTLHEQIGLFEERRQALVTAAVTGELVFGGVAA